MGRVGHPAPLVFAGLPRNFQLPAVQLPDSCQRPVLGSFPAGPPYNYQLPAAAATDTQPQLRADDFKTPPPVMPPGSSSADDFKTPPPVMPPGSSSAKGKTTHPSGLGRMGPLRGPIPPKPAG
eukprot:XP_001699925.1 predicted protein [Chlamydomonas reinhardtii]